MPRSLDPNARLTMVLACDVDKVPQPKIFARNPTLAQQRKLMQAMGRMQGAKPEDAIDAALDAAEACLIGWENMIDPLTCKPIEFTRDNIAAVLNLEELTEVFTFVTSSSTPGPDDKKK